MYHETTALQMLNLEYGRGEGLEMREVPRTDDGEVLDVSWRRLTNISKNTRPAWEPREAPDASLSSLTPLPVWPNTPFVVKIIRQFLTPLIFSITINNRSSLLNLIIGPSRCYLRTRLSFGLTKKYMNERLKCPSVLLRRAGTPCRTG